MLPYFWYLLKVMICSGILFGYYWLFLRNKIFHQYNRFYLLAAMCLSLLLPLLKINFWQPAATQNQAIRVLQAVSVGDEYMVIASQKSNWSFQQVYPLAYWLISLIFFVVMLRTIYLIHRLLKKYTVQQIEEVSFVNTEDDSTPFSFFKYIFWNSSIDINSTTGRQIFKHEVAHIEEKHTYDKLFINFTLIFCWCNPFFWLYRKELNMIHEFIADKKAVEDSDTSAFAAMILQAAYPRHRFELANNFFYSPIKRRLLMLTKNNSPKVSYIARLMVLPLAALIFAAFSLKAKTNPKTRKLVPFEVPKTIIETTIDPTTFYEVADTVPFKTIADIDLGGKQPLYVVNGKETDKSAAENIKPEDIQDVRIIKDAIAVKVYGDKGKNGVIIINTKPGFGIEKSKWTADIVRVTGNQSEIWGANPLMIVDNTEYPGKTLDEIADLTGITKFASVDIYTGDEAIKTFGEKAKDGAVVALTNQSSFKTAYADADKRSVLYIGIENPVKVNVPDVKPEDLVMNISEGLISGINGNYIVKVHQTGDVTLTLSKRDGTKLPGSFTVKVKRLPEPSDLNFPIELRKNLKYDSSNFSLLKQNLIEEQQTKIVQGYSQNQIKLSAADLLSEKEIEERKMTDRQLLQLKQNLLLQEQNNAKLNHVLKERLVLGQKLNDQQILNKKQKLLLEKQDALKLRSTEKNRVVLERKLNELEMQKVKQKLLVEQTDAAKLNAELKELQVTELKLSANTAILKEKELLAQQNNKIFTQVEAKPHFTGGQEAWLKYLQANLKVNTAVDNGAKAGKYTVVLRFIVNADGSLSDIKCENDPGYGICAEAIRFIKTTPRWQPAIQNGNKVNAFLKQPITFVIGQ